MMTLALLLIPSPRVSGQQPVKADFPVPIEVAPRDRVVSLPFGDQVAIVYELLIANPAPRSLAVERVEVVGEGGVLAAWEGQALVGRAKRLPDAEPTEKEASLIVQPGERYLLYMWIDSLALGSVPKSIGHRISIHTEDSGEPIRWILTTKPVPVEHPSIVIDAPVRGGRWLVGNGFSNDADHRRFATASGELFIPQRFGADFVKLGDDGNNAGPERPLRNEVFHAFDEPLHAVADAEVVTVHRGLPDNDAGSAPGPLAWRDVPGNHVVLKLEDGVFALYAHLREGSIRVRPGQQIERGDVVGRIGNSGNTSAPHLHFHMMDGPDPNLSEGIPFTFVSFEVLLEGYTFSADQLPFPVEGRTSLTSLPRMGWVVTFPQGR